MQRGLFGEASDGGITAGQRELPFPEPSELERHVQRLDQAKQPPADDLWAGEKPKGRPRGETLTGPS